MKAVRQHYCPVCSAKLVSDPIDTPLRCMGCTWHLISLSAWLGRDPFEQGYLLYMQSDWPTSELRGKKNPYPRDTPAWTEFCRGEQRATQSAQDGEE